MPVPTILVTGPVGVGKTTLITEMSAVLREAEIRHATVDFDQLTACYPRPADDDQWGTKLGLTNLAAIWRNYRESGADHLLIARVIESRAQLDGFRAAVPDATITVVRLRASVETLRARVRRRELGTGMKWHLDRAAELAPLMDRQEVEDQLVDSEGRDPTDLARAVLRAVGWLDRTARPSAT